MDKESLTNRVQDLREKYSDTWKGLSLAIIEDTKLESDYLIDLFNLIGVNKDNTKFTRFVSGESLLDGLDERNFDVFIVDAELQGVIKGPDLVPRIKDQFPDATIISRTGSRENYDRFEREGVDLALFKDPRQDFLDMFELILKTRSQTEKHLFPV